MSVLEAFQAGIPVIGSPAVAWQIGDAGRAVSDNTPYRVGEVIYETREALRMHSYHEAALRRAAEFDWSVSLAGYDRVLLEACSAIAKSA